MGATVQTAEPIKLNPNYLNSDACSSRQSWRGGYAVRLWDWLMGIWACHHSIHFRERCFLSTLLFLQTLLFIRKLVDPLNKHEGAIAHRIKQKLLDVLTYMALAPDNFIINLHVHEDWREDKTMATFACIALHKFYI